MVAWPAEPGVAEAAADEAAAPALDTRELPEAAADEAAPEAPAAADEGAAAADEEPPLQEKGSCGAEIVSIARSRNRV
jgi:hypothetical protein